MSYLLYFILAALSVVFLVTLANILTAPMLKNGPNPLHRPLVSVLIPARNEAHTVGTALSSLIRQTYKNIEILVLDDGSEDGTSAVVKKFSAVDERIRLIRGQPLPAGWTGKNWACHQLSGCANGDYYIFTDADNFYADDAVEKTIGWMQKLDLSLFSAFPQQITRTLGEKLVVPVFDTFVYSLLPLWLTYYAKFPSMAAANGQWIAFACESYRRIGGHQAVKKQIVEDTELARLAKRRGEKIITAAGREAVMACMYSSWREVYWGFSKNAFGLMGYKTVSFFLFVVLLFSLYILPYILVWFQPLTDWAMAAILLGMAIRLMMAIKYAHPLVVGVLLNPLSIAATLLIALNSFRSYRRGNIRWKNRQISFRDAGGDEER